VQEQRSRKVVRVSGELGGCCAANQHRGFGRSARLCNAHTTTTTTATVLHIASGAPYGRGHVWEGTSKKHDCRFTQAVQGVARCNDDRQQRVSEKF